MSLPKPLIAQATEKLVERVTDQFETEDHLSRALENTVIPSSIGNDHYGRIAEETPSFDASVKLYLHKQIKDLSDKKLVEELTNLTYLRLRYDIPVVLRQQAYSRMWRKRFSEPTRDALDEAAVAIARIAADQGIIDAAYAPEDPDEADTDDNGNPTRSYKREKAIQAIRLARQHVTPHFQTTRAANKTYSDQEIFDVLARMCGSRASSHSEGEYAWLTDDDYTPDGSTILRAIKNVGTPSARQSTVSEFDGAPDDTPELPADIAAIRDAVIEPFKLATKNIINHIDGDDPFDDRYITAAIDITTEQIYTSPWEDKDAGITNPLFPEMASGYYSSSKGHCRVFKYATITLVGDNVPIILGIEPVRENSNWQSEDAHSDSKAAIVSRLLDQASQFVDIDRVMFDREFPSHEALKEVAARGITYVSPLKKYADHKKDVIDIINHPTADRGVVADVPLAHEGRVHDANFAYVPSREEDGKYAIFVTNKDNFSMKDLHSIPRNYRRRWDIENQYKSIKDFLPRTSSMDYRVRLLNVVFATLVYNLWRLTDYLIKRTFNIPVRADPVIGARTFVKGLGNFLQEID